MDSIPGRLTDEVIYFLFPSDGESEGSGVVKAASVVSDCLIGKSFRYSYQIYKSGEHPKGLQARKHYVA
jgi:hypothetical protein